MGDTSLYWVGRFFLLSLLVELYVIYVCCSSITFRGGTAECDSVSQFDTIDIWHGGAVGGLYEKEARDCIAVTSNWMMCASGGVGDGGCMPLILMRSLRSGTGEFNIITWYVVIVVYGAYLFVSSWCGIMHYWVSYRPRRCVTLSPCPCLARTTPQLMQNLSHRICCIYC